jgi:hypothetical protein
MTTVTSQNNSGPKPEPAVVVVREAGIEPARPKAPGPKPGASA